MSIAPVSIPATRGRILFVDDEPALLKGVERSLRPTRAAWQCDFVDNPAAALELMQQTAFQVVVSDMQMPGMNGAEFLAQVKARFPETVRVMLTGNADLPTALAAVNEGHIFQLLLKPCEGDRLIQSVAAALLQHRLENAERELLREQLAHADQMATVGRVAAGLTHDLNNILSAILIQSELESYGVAPNPAFALIHEAATSAAALTRELNSFGRKPLLGDKQYFQLAEPVEATLRLARPLLKHKIRLHTTLAADAPELWGDAGKFKRALMNLLLNARDAMPDGGDITITSQLCQFTDADRDAHPRSRPGTFLCVSVQDTGAGIAPLMQEQIFLPYFTTKSPDKGLGLGLFMVQRIVTEHEGWVELESIPGQGTSFRLYFPARSDAKLEEGV